jgi:hypothetical protein
MSVGQKTSPYGVSSPLVCSPSSFCLVLAIESSVVLVVFDVVVVAIIAEVHVWTEVVLGKLSGCCVDHQLCSR